MGRSSRYRMYFKTRKAYMAKKSRDRPEKCSQNFRYIMEVTGQTPPATNKKNVRHSQTWHAFGAI